MHCSNQLQASIHVHPVTRLSLPQSYLMEELQYVDIGRMLLEVFLEYAIYCCFNEERVIDCNKTHTILGKSQ